MSTTFGVLVPSLSDVRTEVIEIAFRSKNIFFINPLAQLLPLDTVVIAMDNTPQGIYTIGDIKKEIEKQNKTNNNHNKES